MSAFDAWRVSGSHFWTFGGSWGVILGSWDLILGLLGNLGGHFWLLEGSFSGLVFEVVSEDDFGTIWGQFWGPKQPQIDPESVAKTSLKA